MNFNRGRRREELEINFIPLIDMLLVILIFLMVTTTYSRFAELHINLPTANAETEAKQVEQIVVGVDRNGRYVINDQEQPFQSISQFAEVLHTAAGKDEPVIVIHADAQSSHQSVVNIMEAARVAGLNKLTFATQTVQQ